MNRKLAFVFGEREPLPGLSAAVGAVLDSSADAGFRGAIPVLSRAGLWDTEVL